MTELFSFKSKKKRNLIESKSPVFKDKKRFYEEMDGKDCKGCWINKNAKTVEYLEARVILQKKEISIYDFLFGMESKISLVFHVCLFLVVPWVC